jgi:hypothetical protein
MIYPGTHIIDTGPRAGLVTWAMAKVHLGLTTDEYKTAVEAMINSATIWAEMYTNRCACERDIIIHYVHPGVWRETTAEFKTRFYPDRDTINVRVTDSEGVETTLTSADWKLLPEYQQSIVVSGLSDWEMVTISYTALSYTQREALIPPILMKVGQMFMNRTDGEQPRMSAAISILNPHRLKYHP